MKLVLRCIQEGPPQYAKLQQFNSLEKPLNISELKLMGVGEKTVTVVFKLFGSLHSKEA
jgi:hypothetical protein